VGISETVVGRAHRAYHASDALRIGQRAGADAALAEHLAVGDRRLGGVTSRCYNVVAALVTAGGDAAEDPGDDLAQVLRTFLDVGRAGVLPGRRGRGEREGVLQRLLAIDDRRGGQPQRQALQPVRRRRRERLLDAGDLNFWGRGDTLTSGLQGGGALGQIGADGGELALGQVAVPHNPLHQGLAENTTAGLLHLPGHPALQPRPLGGMCILERDDALATGEVAAIGCLLAVRGADAGRLDERLALLALALEADAPAGLAGAAALRAGLVVAAQLGVGHGAASHGGSAELVAFQVVDVEDVGHWSVSWSGGRRQAASVCYAPALSRESSGIMRRR